MTSLHFSQSTYSLRRAFAMMMVITLFALSLVIATNSRADAAVDTCTWTGTTSGAWATGSNWSGCDNGGVPETGDTLVFPSGASNTAMNNNLSIVVASATFSLGGSGYAISGNTFDLSGTLNVFSSVTFTSQVRYIAASGIAQLNVQSSTPTFTGGIDMNLTGTASLTIFTTNSTFNLPVITGTTVGLSLAGNPTAPLETYNTQTSAQTFTANQVFIERSIVNCQSATGCLGDSANVVYVEFGDANATAKLQLNVDGMTFPYNVVFDSFSTTGPPSIQIVEDATMTGTVTLSTDATISVDATKALLLNGNVALGANGITYAGGGGSQIIHNGTIAGTGDVNVTGFVQMINNNSYTGDTLVNAGATLAASAANAMGTTAGNTTVASGGSILFESFGAPTTFPENITVEGDGPASAGALQLYTSSDNATLSGTITLTGNTLIRNLLAGTSQFIFTGAIAGTGDLTLSSAAGAGGFELSGTSINTFAGITTVLDTTLELNKTGSGVSIPGDVTVLGTTSGTILMVETDNQIADDAIVTLTTGSGSANLSLPSGTEETVGSIEGNGTIQLDDIADNLSVGGGNKSGTFSGSVSSAGAVIHKIGTGTWTMNGTNNINSGLWPTYDVQAGTLLANFSDTSGGFSPFTVTGGTLGGNDIIGPTTVTSGNVAPGNSPGCLNPDGNVTFSSGTNLTVEINGAAPCTGYDKFAASGVVVLGGATLNLSLGYIPTLGTTYSIVEGSSVTGTFAGMPEGAKVSTGTITLQISYTSTSVVLTVVPTPAAGTLSDTGSNVVTVVFVAMLLLGTGFVLRRRSSRISFVS